MPPDLERALHALQKTSAARKQLSNILCSSISIIEGVAGVLGESPHKVHVSNHAKKRPPEPKLSIAAECPTQRK